MIIRTLVSASRSDGAVAVFEEPVPPGMGPPLHRHVEQLEVFHVISGTFRFHLDGEEFDRGAGAAVVIPKGAIHAFKNVGEDEGLLHFEMVPALNAEALFNRIANGDAGDTAAIAAEFGMEVVGPPI